MSEAAPTAPQPGEFDPVAAAQQIAQEHHNQQVKLNEWIGVPGSTDPAAPHMVAPAARRTSEYFGNRPTAQDERTYDPRYEHPVGMPSAGVRYGNTEGEIVRQTRNSMPSHEHYDASMPKDKLADATLADLIVDWAQSEINKDRTRANDVQDRLQDRLIKSGADANMIDTLYAQKEKMKAALIGAKGTETSESQPEPEPKPPTEPEPAPEPTEPTPPTGEPGPDEGEPEPGPDEPDEPEGPKPPEGGGAKADDRPTAELPPLKNGKLPNFWETADIARAKARARGEKVPERTGPLPADYFDRIVDLPQDAISLLHMIGEANTAIAKGEYPSTERQNIIGRLTDRLAASNPGMADKLIDIYGIGGRFQHEGMKLTARDAELIDLMHQYKANERDNSIRRKISDLLAKINAEEDPVPVNWHEAENGPITPVGTATLSKGDWLFERHKGTLVRKQFEDMAKGTESVMAQPIGRLGRAGRAILRSARVLDPRSYLKSGVDTSETGALYSGRGPRTPENPEGWVVPPKK